MRVLTSVLRPDRWKLVLCKMSDCFFIIQVHYKIILTSLPMCGFIAQLVEHRTGIAEVTGSNPVEALIFFQASSFQLLKLENILR